MFNKAKIKALENEIKSLEVSQTYLRQEYNSLRNAHRELELSVIMHKDTLNRLFGYLRLEEEYQGPRTIVRKKE